MDKKVNNLIIVESPTKAKTISRFLGKGFSVESSYGHIRDLPTYTIGVDVQNNFEPKYVVPRKSQKVVKKLKDEVKQANRIILATDEDREGEAIAWHLLQALGLHKTKEENAKNKSVERIVFHEITKKAIEEALKHPRPLNKQLVDAQQARRILDRLVGYELSPFLWKKVARGLSAGRVQSVTVRLIVEREREIQKFTPQEYWTIESIFSGNKKASDKTQEFPAHLIKIKNEMLEKFSIPDTTSAEKIIRELNGATFAIENVEKHAVTKKPHSPFTTSTLQQEASRRLGFSAKQTMLIAQQLYEGIELGEGPVGLITYMRTDSMNLAEDALIEAKQFLAQAFGERYSLPTPRRFKTKSKGAQEAHEAIRPTDPARTSDAIKPFLNRNQWRLYDLIWRRFIATQMPEAIFDATTIDITATTNNIEPSTNNYTFRANGQIMQFDGFLKVYSSHLEETILPELAKNESVTAKEIKPFQHFTEPPPRYSEATLIKTLEQFGIGRPSTYAPTIATIQDRGYVIKDEKKRFSPTEIGTMVNDLLVEHFPQVVDIEFTAKMEAELDEIAEGKREWQPVIKAFYEPFEKNLKEKLEEVEKQNPDEATNEVCEKCGKPMIIKFGRFGKFMACSGFPECKNTRSLKNPATDMGMACPKCVEGSVIIKKTRRGKIFYGCSRWPECDFAAWGKPTGEKCPKCANPLIEVKNGIKCNNKACDYKEKKLTKATAESPDE